MTFSDETKKEIIDAQNGYCRSEGCYNPIHSIHHKIHNTKDNNQNYPNFIQSPINGVGLCLHCHDQHAHKFSISHKEAEMYERHLAAIRDGQLVLA